MSTISLSTASNLAFTDGTQPLGTKAGSDGDVLTYDTVTETWKAEAAAATGVGGSTGSVDNALLRANGTGGSTLQAGAAAVLTDNATLSLDGGANAVRLILDADPGQAKIVSWRTNDTQRFAIRVDGGDDDAAFRRYDDAGAFVANVWAADRSTGVMTIGELALTTDLAVADGGTGASTELGAKSSLQITGLATDQSTLTTAMVEVGYTSTQAVTLPAASGANAGQPIRCYNASTSTIVLTFSRAGSDTIRYGSTTGATSAAISIPASSAIVLIREAASVWRVVQPCSVGVTGARIYQSGGVLYAVGRGIGPSGRVDVGAPVAMTAVAGGDKVTQTGTDIVLASGAVAAATPAPDVIGGEGQCWWVALSALGVTAPGFGDRITSLIKMTTRPTVDRAYVGCALLSGEWATSAETVYTSALGYGPANKLAKWSGATGTFSTATANAGIDLLTVQMGARLDKGLVQYTDSAKTASTSLSTTVAPSTAAPTHLGFFVCAAGGNTASAATFGDVVAYLDFVAAP